MNQNQKQRPSHMEYPRVPCLVLDFSRSMLIDLPSAITFSEVCLFADDSTFYFIGTNIEKIIDAVNETGN